MPQGVVSVQPQVSATLQPSATTAAVSAQPHPASPSAAEACRHSVTNSSS